jgi:hypothetical protein
MPPRSDGFIPPCIPTRAFKVPIGPDWIHEVKRSLGIVLSQHTDEYIFRRVCQMGLEGVVSKRLSSPYRSGRSTDWLKIKNPNSPAMNRAREAEW